MRFGSVCSGIEAASVAWMPLEWKPVFYSEIEAFPSEVLKVRHQNVPNCGDITQFKQWPDYAIDVLVGGTPCQSFSVAGLRKGLDDPRGNMALVFLGIVDRYRPRWVVWENVPGVHSSWTDAKTHPASEESVKAGEAAERYAIEAGFDAETARSFGEFDEVDQSNDFDCFLGALEQLGYGIATTILDAQYFDLAQRRERVFVVGHIGGWQRAAAILFERENLRGDSPPSRETGKRVAPTLEGRPGHSRAGDHDASEDGTGRGVLIVTAIQSVNMKRDKKQHGIGISESTMYTLTKRDQHAVAFTQNQRQEVRELNVAGCQPSIRLGDAKNETLLSQRIGVRRLTPRECERLMGFPDDYTLIPWHGKSAEKCPDGPRYKAIGNSMAIPCMIWIGKRIAEIDAIT